jgi:arginyl-tRNA synthetase
LKNRITQLLATAATTLHTDGVLPDPIDSSTITVERSRDEGHGDFATNLALTLAKSARTSPRDLATQLIAALPADEVIDKVEIAGPGFINFFLKLESLNSVVADVLAAGSAWGRSDLGASQSVLLEYVSANPTGPLHVGHGRGAAYGSTLAALLQFAGYKVAQEYYVNDAGRQMDILATSIWLRYLEAGGIEISFPSAGYKGDYIRDLGETLRQQQGSLLHHSAEAVLSELPTDQKTTEDGETEGDKEAHIDGLISRAKTLLQDNYAIVHALGKETIVADIRDDLAQFGVHYDHWFEESSLVKSGAVKRAIDQLQHAGHLYQRDGALWFRSTEFGDQKDRVVLRDNGEPTYFATDIAYHLEKLDRGYDQLIDIWGSDHHGYVPRVKASITALGQDSEKLAVLLVQFAVLYRGSEKIAMSTRSGEFVTLRQLRDEVGSDATRFFYVMHKADQHMDFDLELAKSSSNDNPVYYVQYAHARIGSVLRQLAESGRDLDSTTASYDLLTESHEQTLITLLARFPEMITNAAGKREPHLITYYLRDLATALHSYYNAHQFLVDDATLCKTRIDLIVAVKTVLANGLELLGVTAPERM